MNYTILDCYTDEASGLGVPPYLGTYPRYIYGLLKNQGHNPNYITIDDFRLHYFFDDKLNEVTGKDKTNIRAYNLTKSVKQILDHTEILIIILGVHVPGKYLSAVPGTILELMHHLDKVRCKKILTGPAVFGTQLEGGKFSEKLPKNLEIKQYGIEFGEFDKLQEYALKGSEIIKEIPDYRIIEIETSRGCNVGKCSFCTEPLKNRFSNRKTEHIIQEIKQFYDLGCRYFRLGKQADFYSIEDPILLLKTINKKFPDIEILHIDNVNPVSVISKKGIDITKAIVKYCTPGNVAAFGVESFDPEVIKANTLNCSPKIAMKAIEIVNKYGQVKGENGMPTLLPGINIILGLGKETKKTHEYNIKTLKEIYDNGMMLRRINIRQASILPNTKLSIEFGSKFLNKNKKHYWKWRNEIRQKIDFPMLKRIVPKGTILKKIYSEIYDGKTTFGRQIGTYPLIVGIKERIPLKKFYTIEVTDHMLRSIVGKVIP
ncbi:radical SAM protein [archaeon]|jgi:radical SAM superfamily enzyme with C-terminal helix-hairpin-helix motif|nr:radical SAM protein [archaeon]MBT4022958.1 radical SAM protein [archaeon]MBT4271949.1 radical SAM protein [archaeon]MBT4461787.1 radical SAM protein [archaeon]MBT4858198.1 radical SAM protein [archaeon]